MTPTHFLLIEQPSIAEAPRSTMLMPAADLAQQFSEADRARLALGKEVEVGSVIYTDLVAFHSAHRDCANPNAGPNPCDVLFGPITGPRITHRRPITPPPPKPNR